MLCIFFSGFKNLEVMLPIYLHFTFSCILMMYLFFLVKKGLKMVMCFAPDCKHYSDQKICKFFVFPANQVEKRRWIALIRYLIFL